MKRTKRDLDFNKYKSFRNNFQIQSENLKSFKLTYYRINPFEMTQTVKRLVETLKTFIKFMKILPISPLIASSQAKGTNSTSFLTCKERSGDSTLGLRRCTYCRWPHTDKANILNEYRHWMRSMQVSLQNSNSQFISLTQLL